MHVSEHIGILALIMYVSSKGSDEPAQVCSLI